MTQQSTAVVFDLDGTLIDSAEDLHQAGLKMLQDAGLPPVTLEQTIRFIGDGAPKLVERMIRAGGGDVSQKDRLFERYMVYYDRDPVTKSTLFPGVPEALDALEAAGHRLAICTNKPEGSARHMAEHFGLAERMVTLIGGDTLPVKKPDPAPLYRAIAATGAEKVLYVGDSEIDSATAVAAKVPFAIFTEGYRNDPVEEIPHQVAFSSFDRLPDLVENLLNPIKPGSA